jgi:hypothetical protein
MNLRFFVYLGNAKSTMMAKIPKPEQFILSTRVWGHLVSLGKAWPRRLRPLCQAGNKKTPKTLPNKYLNAQKQIKKVPFKENPHGFTRLLHLPTRQGG